MTRLLSLALVLLLVAAPAAAQEKPAAPMSEREFIELAGAEQPGDSKPDSGRPMEPAKGEDPPPKKKEDEDPDPAAAGDGDDAGDGSADDGEDSPAGDDDDTPVVAADDAHDAGDGSADDADEEIDDTPAPTAEETAAFEKALAEEGVQVSVDKLPKEAQPIVRKVLKDMNAGFTRKLQELAEDKKAARAWKAEERFRTERPADFIVAMLRAKPELADEVNAIVGELEGNATAAKGHDAIVEQARREAAKKESDAEDKVAAGAQRVQEIVRLGRAAAKAHKVPFDAGVEDAIAAHVAVHGDITPAQIQTIAKAKAAVFQRTLRQGTRNKRGQYVDDKVRDRQRAPVRVKPGEGTAPGPGGRPMAKTDAEFIEEFAGRSD